MQFSQILKCLSQTNIAIKKPLRHKLEKGHPALLIYLCIILNVNA